jgi:hypothetical protein
MLVYKCTMVTFWVTLQKQKQMNMSCWKPRPGFPISYVVVYVQWIPDKLRWEVITCSIDIGRNCWFLLLKLSFHDFFFRYTHTARTTRFSKKSPWSVFFRGEMSVICHKITVKCRWNHGETFTTKINKLGPKCRWNILIAGDNTAAKIIRVYTYM